jgi:RNA polymerase sigma factor (sigma-70 family)
MGRMSSALKDSELLLRYVRLGSEAEFAQLVERHLSLVYGAAFRRLQSSALAEDVTQKTFVTLSRRAIWLLGHPSLSGWLYRTAINLAQHAAREEGRRRQRERIAIELGTTMETENSLTKELTPVLDELILELRAKDREVLLLRFMSNKSLREVGEVLGIREDAAQKRVSKAVGAITDRFRRRGFNVAGLTAMATALHANSALAIPVGLATATTKTAAGVGVAASLGAFAASTIKIMSLTNTQTLGVCLAIATVPLGYQWHSLNQTREMNRGLSEQLGSLQGTALAMEGEREQTDQRIVELERKLAALPAESEPADVLPIVDPADLYVWDETSDYIRIPRGMLDQVRLGGFATRTNRHGREVRAQKPPLRADGSLHPALEAALGLSEDERRQMTELNETAFDQFFEVMSTHSTIEEKPFSDDGRSVTYKTEPFEAYGSEFSRWFRERLVALLGDERAATFWSQAQPVFEDTFNEFGSMPRTLQVIDRVGQPLTLMEGYRGGHSIGELDKQPGRILPPALDVYVTHWKEERQLADR